MIDNEGRINICFWFLKNVQQCNVVYEKNVHPNILAGNDS